VDDLADLIGAIDITKHLVRYLAEVTVDVV
jgi:hypothetical protein